jgi:hypothetical protein
VQENDADLTILLPNTESALLLGLLKALEQEVNQPGLKLGIESYGISMTSLEDVFLKITSDETEHTDAPKRSVSYSEQQIEINEDNSVPLNSLVASIDSAEGTSKLIFDTCQ